MAWATRPTPPNTLTWFLATESDPFAAGLETRRRNLLRLTDPMQSEPNIDTPGATSAMLTLAINGKIAEMPAEARTLADLVVALGLTGKRIAIERNGEVVPKSRHAATPVVRGDRIEIVGAVGGG